MAKNKETKLLIKRLTDESVTPTFATEFSAGMDLYASEDVVIPPLETVIVHTGIAMEIPKWHFGGIYARSGLSIKEGLRPSNCVGVIDSDYRGEILVALHNDSRFERKVESGNRIAQMIIQRYVRPNHIELVEELSETERGEGGLGSTGK